MSEIKFKIDIKWFAIGFIMGMLLSVSCGFLDTVKFAGFIVLICFVTLMLTACYVMSR